MQFQQTGYKNEIDLVFGIWPLLVEAKVNKKTKVEKSNSLPCLLLKREKKSPLSFQKSRDFNLKGDNTT